MRVITQDGNIIEATMRYVTLDGNIIEGATRHVTIEWEGPFTIEHVLTLTDKKDYGLYQIYDRGKRFYIGKTEGKSFRDRFKEHKRNNKWLKEIEKPLIRIGRIAVKDYEDEPKDDRWTDWRRLLQDVEKLLIYYHSQRDYQLINKRDTKTYNGPPLYIVNKGDTDNLDKIVTSNNLDTH